ncbi:MAG: type II secretion system secretin GspD [Bryobacterales bacterium]|nr:type II secretion system secretin GspD [Bryobacterales bacterium]
MRIVRFRIPEIALAVAMTVAHLPLAQAMQAPTAPPVVVPPGFGLKIMTPEQANPQQPQPAAPGARPATTAAQVGQPLQASPGTPLNVMQLQNVSLVEVVDFLARELKINYIMDKNVGGGVTLNTYGPVKDMDKRALLDTVLRINGAAMVQTGDIYRIVPLQDLSHMPVNPEQDVKDIPADDRPMLNLIFLKYANVDELSKLIGEFLGPQGKAWAYAPANLLLVLDGRRSMRRTMEMVALFDSDVLAKQRVKLFDLKHSRPTDMAKEMEGLLKSMSLSKEMASVKFVPVDRINTLIAVAPNPGVFEQIQEWVNRLDVKVKGASGKADNYVYRVKYSRADSLAYSIMMLYGGGMGMGGYGMGGMGMGGMGMGGMYGGMGGGMYGGGMYGGQAMMGGTMTGYAANAQSAMGGGGGMGVGPQGVAGTGMGAVTTPGGDMTGSYLGMMAMGGGMGKGPRVVPNPTDNSLLILATPEEYDSVSKMLAELDIPPRQVLIEARIYEVKLTGALQWGLNWYINHKNDTPASGSTEPNSRSSTANFVSSALTLSSGALLSQSKQILATLSLQDVATKTKVISTPSIIATDSIPASINVGSEVPTLTAQAVTGAQQGGNSLFANSISNRKTGVTLTITARVNPSGVVTLIINQEVSSPVPPAVGGIQSPSFSQRTLQTQVTVQDGDMIAIGGIINETNGETSSGIPLLHRLPGIGWAFGNKAFNKERTELVVFITPRVIYDTNEMADATDELISNMKRLQKIMR